MKKAVTTVVLFTLLLMPLLNVSAQLNQSNRKRATQKESTEKVSNAEVKGPRVVVPAATTFGTVEAVSDGSSVLAKWTMKQEVSNLGFDVYRLDAKGEHKVTTDIVLGAATRFHAAAIEGESYEFFDENADGNAVYIVEALGMNGQRLRSDAVVPATVNSLRAESPRTKADGSASNIESASLALPKVLSAEIDSNAVAPDPATHRAVISRPGVKIGVKGEGFFRVTRAELQAGGFDVNGDSNLWQLYVNGVEQAITIGPNANYIEFYGKGVDTIESDIATYYLITGDNAGKRIQSRSVRLATSTVVATNYPETVIRKERTFYLSNILNGSAENYFGRLISSTVTTYPLVLTGVDPNGPDVTLTLNVLGYSLDAHMLEVTLNGHAFTAVPAFGRGAYSATFTVPAQWLNEGTNSLQLRSGGASGDFSFFDKVQVSYNRRFVADQNQLKAFTLNNKNTNVDGFTTANVRVFDITNENEPVLAAGVPVVQNGATFTAAIPAARGRLIFALADSAVKSVQSVVPNDPALLGLPTNGANLVIIAHKSLLAQANAWADYRRSQGISVMVVESTEIYDEFNYGVLSSDSIRSFLAYAKNNWQTPPGYVLLIGDASYDSRNYEGRGYFNMVPTLFVDTFYTEVGSDEAMADFNNDGLAEIAIGRIPTRLPQDAADILTRQIAWEAAVTTPLARGTVFAFDVPETYDFEGMSNRMRAQLPAGTPATMVGRASATPGADLLAAINTNPYLVNYSGHGSSGLWADVSFFSINSVPQLTNPPAGRPIYTLLTCLNGYFMNNTNDSLAEVLLKAPNGGAVAAWASTGETTPDVQEIMGLRFYNQIGSGPATLNRLGDLIIDAKAQLPGTSDVRLSWALLGDPMLKVR